MRKTKATAPLKSSMEWADAMRADPAHREAIDAMMTEIDIEQDLIALREERGMTQVELAKRIGVSQPVIARIESGKAQQNMELRTLVKLAAALGAKVKISFEKYDTATKSKRTILTKAA
jgi:DNA-binding XRE family transcriptional regulator